MKPLLPAALVAAICISMTPVMVQGFGRLSIYSNASLTDCTLSDTSPGLVSVYVAEQSDEATGLRFRIAASPGFTGVWLSETSPFVTIGTSPTDLSIGFGSCQTGQFLVLTVAYLMFGTSACSQLTIAAAGGFPEPICTWCSFHELPCSGYDPLHVNCTGPFDCNPVSSGSSTWGRVKALYR